MKKKIWWVVSVVILLIAGGVFLMVSHSSGGSDQGRSKRSGQSAVTNNPIEAGKRLSNGRCRGKGPGTLTKLPMDENDFSMIIPYGFVVDDHVTPIDHQYFSPTVFHSPRDAYPVYAMADATIVDIQPRTNERGTEYRFVFVISCTFLYYYDLVTSLAPEIKTVYEQTKRFDLELPVKAGQLIGRIGGQTLDFAVWDTTKPLSGLVVPDHYQAEPWKLYTADPLDYYSPEVKAKALAKYLRDVPPISGKIDYDIDGKLIGNWFLEGTEGYGGAGGGARAEQYWSGHLAIVPDHLDPTATIFSIGSWNGGGPKQWLVAPGAPDPATVGPETGVVRYELYQDDHIKPDGRSWDRFSLVRGLKAVPAQGFGGCVLIQMTEARVLKAEEFDQQKCAGITSFTSKAQIYRR